MGKEESVVAIARHPINSSGRDAGGMVKCMEMAFGLREASGHTNDDGSNGCMN